MDDKYYTPSIEEFRVGFEFEYLAPSGEWESFKCYEETPDGKIEWRKLKRSDLKDIRVKYLDREDIESLGFTYTTKDDETVYRKDNSIAVIMHSGHNKHRYIIYNGADGFKGKIWNKSELKKILEHLSVK